MWEIYVQVRDNQKLESPDIIFTGELGLCFSFLDSIKDQTISGVMVDRVESRNRFFTIVNSHLRFQNTPFRDTSYILE